MGTPVVGRHHLNVFDLPTTVSTLAFESKVGKLDVVIDDWQ